MHDQSNSWSIQLINSFSSNWFTLLLLCTSAPLVLYCDRFDRGSTQVKREPVDLLMEDYEYHFLNELGFITITQKIISLLVIGVHLGILFFCTLNHLVTGYFWWGRMKTSHPIWNYLYMYFMVLLWYFILRNVMEYMKLIILPAFLEGAVFLKRRKMPKGYLVIVICMWPGSCRWQPTNDEKLVHT